MRRNPELMQFEMGMSTNRYFPASGTAGFARSLVSGNRRVPCPPPMMTERTLLVLIDCRPVYDIRILKTVAESFLPYKQLAPQSKTNLRRDDQPIARRLLEMQPALAHRPEQFLSVRPAQWSVFGVQPINDNIKDQRG